MHIHPLLRRFIFTLSFTFSSLLACSMAQAAAPEYGEKPAPLDRYEYVDGSKLSLPDLVGTPVVLYFGGEWCPPCHETRPAIEAIDKAFRAKGVVVIFVSADDNKLREQKKLDSVQKNIRIAMPTFEHCPVGKCPTGTRPGEFGRIFKYPTAIVLDAQGVLRHKLQGSQSIKDEIYRAVNSTLP